MILISRKLIPQISERNISLFSKTEVTQLNNKIDLILAAASKRPVTDVPRHALYPDEYPI